MKNKKTKLAPTPETDSESFDARGLTYCCCVVPEDFAQSLERQRNQWSECAEMLANALWAEVSGELRVNSATHHALLEFEKLNGEAK